MFPIPDALAAVYLICFVVGFLFVFVSLFLGLSHDTLHLPGLGGGHASGVDVGGTGHAGGIDVASDASEIGHAGHPPGSDGDVGRGPAHHGVSPINISTIMAFLTWFGGAGYILRVYAGLAGVASVAASTLVGLVGGAIVFYFLVKVLIPGQRFMRSEDYLMVGTVARVTVPIAPNRPGEIVYSKGGSRRSEGARAENGGAIEHGTEVVIVRYERGIAYVEPWSSYVDRG